MKRFGICFGALTILALLPVTASCQTNSVGDSNTGAGNDTAPQTAKVAGVVKTALNAPVPRSMVRVIHLPSGRSWVSWTDDDGKFSFPGLPAGRYRLEARQLGFGKTEAEMEFVDRNAEEASLTLHVEISSATAAPGTNSGTLAPATITGAANIPEGTRDENRKEESAPVVQGERRKPSEPSSVIPTSSSKSKNRKKEDSLSAADVFAGSDLASSSDEATSSDAIAMSGTVNRAATLGGAGSFGRPLAIAGATNEDSASDPGGGAFPVAGQGTDMSTSDPSTAKVRSKKAGDLVKPKKAKQTAVESEATDFGQGIGTLWTRQNVSRLAANRTHFSIANRYSNSLWNARPYNLTGTTPNKLDTYNDRLDVHLGGPLLIPHIYDGRQRTFFYISTQFNRVMQPLDNFTTVPTESERNGDFSGLGVQLYDPTSNLAGPRAPLGTSIPPSRLDKAALGILAFVPQPNLPGLVDNFHIQGRLRMNTNLATLRASHTISSQLNVSVTYNASVTNVQNPRDFPDFTYNTTGLGQSLTLTLGQNWTPRLSNSSTLNWTRNAIDNLNGFAQTRNLVGELGIQGVSQAPIDWGLPIVHLTNFSEWHDFAPFLQRNQTIRFADNLSYALPKHTIHVGGEVRWMQINADSNPSPRGEFTFTGLMTSQLDAKGIPIPGTGFDFADFLLGYPQNTLVGYGLRNSYTNFRSRAYILYAQDDWRVHPRFAINFGVRYELTTPPAELFNRITDLVLNPEFTAVANVIPGQVNPFTGQPMPRALVKTSPNNWGPRIGIAWRPPGKLPFVLRAGYGIFYNESVYNQLAASMAIQPPFANAQILQTSKADVLTLERGFHQPGTGQVLNTVAVDPNYRVGYAQLWNLSLESQIKPNLVVELDYTGTKGTALDLLRAPNRSSPGSPLDTDLNRRIPNAAGFVYDSSGAFSIFHGFQLVVRRQASHGLIIQGTYAYGKTIDDASSIGGGTPVVVQDDNNIAAERGLSSFDLRHQFRAAFSYDLPFGPSRHWLHEGWSSYLLRNLKISGTSTLTTGPPFTARVLGSAADNTGTGVNMSERADQVGDPRLPSNQRTPLHFFNTNAFVVPPPGQFGDAARNTIPGPGEVNFDFSLAKKFKFGEGARREIEWRWEVMNAFNTPNFLNLNTVVNSLTFGEVQKVRAMRTMDLMLRASF